MRFIDLRGQIKMFEVCLFDLDQTLVRTDDMTELRESGKCNSDAGYPKLVEAAFALGNDRLIYSEDLLQQIREKFPDMKLGVFTRSPRSYATMVLARAYPSVKWDVIIAYEDVKNTKPHGEGIDQAMWSFGFKNISKVVLVGDSDSDIRAAYNAGCVVVLDKTSWKNRFTTDNWRSLDHMPDVIIDNPNELIDVLKNYGSYLPELERLLSGTKERARKPRFDRINKFIRRDCGGDSTAFPILACGRSFSGYASLEWRTKWHQLTKSIHDHKDTDSFPEEWIEAVRTFVRSHFINLLFGGRLVLTVVPHRPGRKPRLEALLNQLADSYNKKPNPGRGTLSFAPDLMGYKDGVRSNSNDKLGAKERFENVRDHLFVRDVSLVKGANILVIDDVCTTGASLIFAKKYLEAAGAADVTCLSISMNISNVLYD